MKEGKTNQSCPLIHVKIITQVNIIISKQTFPTLAELAQRNKLIKRHNNGFHSPPPPPLGTNFSLSLSLSSLFMPLKSKMAAVLFVKKILSARSQKLRPAGHRKVSWT